MTEAAAYLVRYWGATGGPMWAKEAADGDARRRLAAANRADQPVQRLAVYAVPRECAALSFDALVRAAGDGLLQKIFEDAKAARRADGGAA
jgi:hypothetical protein